MKAARLSIAAAALCLGCGEPPPPSPSAVINVTPSSVCLGDDFATEIALDAKDSQARLTLVPVPPGPDDPPLDFSWSFAGAEHRVIEAEPTGIALTVTTRGDRPLHVSLRVRNTDGGEATALASVAVTLPDEAAGVCVGSAP